MILQEYTKKNQSNIMLLLQKNTDSIDNSVPRVFEALKINEDITLKYKSLAVSDDPTAVEDREIQLKKGQILAIFDEPYVMPEKKLVLYKQTNKDQLLKDDINLLYHNIESGISAPTINVLEKHYGKENIRPEQGSKSKNAPKI